MRNNQLRAKIGWDEGPIILSGEGLCRSPTRPHRRACGQGDLTLHVKHSPYLGCPSPCSTLTRPPKGTKAWLLPLCLHPSQGISGTANQRISYLIMPNMHIFVYLLHLVGILPCMLCFIFALKS